MKEGSKMNINNYQKGFTFKSGLKLKNKVMMAPMTVMMSFSDGDVTKDELAYYSQRSGEVGAVITAAANVSTNGKGWEGEVSAESDQHLSSLTSLANAISINGTKAIIQLFHAGRMTNSKILRGNQPVSASAIAAERAGAQIPKAMSEVEILQVIEDFKQAVKRAYDAGFDGVELHGANTYLIQQFFSPHSNRRDDKWGGSLEKRFTFIKLLTDEVLSVKKDFERPFIVGYRFSPEEYEEPGISLKDTLYLVDELANKDLDYLHISLRDYKQKSISKNYQDHTILEYVYKTINKRVPLIGVGNVNTKSDLEDILQSSDLVAVGKALIIDPNWTSKIFSDRQHLINTSIGVESFKQLNITRTLGESLKRMMSEQII